MDVWVQMIITIVGAVLASSGLWAYFQKRLDKKDNKNKLLMGLAHDRIMDLGMSYLSRGDWITQDEYENLNNYLYQPYADENGNGSAKRIMLEVNKLRIVKSPLPIPCSQMVNGGMHT